MTTGDSAEHPPQDQQILPQNSRDIVFFDLETTGLLPELDRIIEIGLLKISPDGKIS